jgi:AcrR family transcriptional regulator
MTPLRQDAVRNRERLVQAAREVFRRKGLGAPLEEIAREAGVAIGTLYNRFAGRGELLDAALAPLAGEAVDLAEQAAKITDPWQAFETLMVQTCELFARDRGYADVYRSRVPGTPVIDAAQQRLAAIKSDIMARAKQAGQIRLDAAPADLAILTWGVIATMDATRDVAPDAWRRHLAVLLDGLRAQGSQEPHPGRVLPGQAMTASQLRIARPG